MFFCIFKFLKMFLRIVTTNCTRNKQIQFYDILVIFYSSTYFVHLICFYIQNDVTKVYSFLNFAFLYTLVLKFLYLPFLDTILSPQSFLKLLITRLLYFFFSINVNFLFKFYKSSNHQFVHILTININNYRNETRNER